MRFDYISEEDVAKLHDATCELLEDCGVRVKSESFIKAAKSVGLAVLDDPNTGNYLVKFTRDQIEQAIKSAPAEWTMHGQVEGHEVHWGTGAAYAQTCVGTPFVAEVGTGEKRATTIQDLADYVRLQDALSDIDIISCLTAQGIPAHAANAVQTACMVKNTVKPLHICVASLREVEQVSQILYAVAGSKEAFLAKPFAYLQPSPVSPLEYGSGPADAIVRVIEEGIPLGIIPCPMCGATGPMTLMGSVVQHNAEMLAGVVLAQLMRPGHPVVMSPRVTFMDMVTTMGLWAAPEMGLANAACVALARSYQIPSEPGGFSCAAKIVDPQAGFEVAYNVLMLGLQRADVIGSAGSLDNALIASYEKLVMDNEVSSMVKRAVRGEVVDRETMAVDAIKDVMENGDRDFLGHDHTIDHCRDELWNPILSDRLLYADWEKDKYTYTQKASMEVTRLLEEHHPNHLSAEVIATIDSLVDAAISADSSDLGH